MINDLSKQKWTKKQKDVWKNVQTYTKLILEGNVEEFLEYFHKDYSSWNYYDIMPVNITDVSNELQHLEMRRIESYDITPLVINVFNNVAIVHYLYSAEYKNSSGSERIKHGHNTDILLKQNNKWILIGDHVRPVDNGKQKRNL